MSLFEFRPGTSLCHTLDPRCKFFLVCLCGITLAAAGWTACLIMLCLAWIGLHRLNITLARLFHQLRFFLIFLAIIVLARGLTQPGHPLVSAAGYHLTQEGLIQGSLIALRFFLIMVIGLIFSSTTRTKDLKAAVQWYLAPVPFIPESQVATTIGLVLRFLPLILSQSAETRLAIQSRCGNLQKNPVKRLTLLVMALMSKSFRSADVLAMAMDARCYSGQRTDPRLLPSGKEPAAMAAGIGVCLVLFFL